MKVTSQDFRQVMGEFPTGVTVVTARNSADGTPFGFTANAVTSVSLEPPLILVCVGREKYAHKVLSQSDFFGINILCRGQDEIARRFAGRDAERFEGLETSDGETGTPFIKGANGIIECEKTMTHDGGDHSIIIGQVKHIEHNPDNAPLVFFRGAFHCLGDRPL